MYCKFHSHTQSFQVRRLLLLGVSAPFRSRPRLFASAAGSIKDNSRQARYHEDKEWPKTLKPTPYEVFGIPAGSRIDQGKLKKRYHELAKLYHPDIAGTIVILSHPRSVENQHAATQIANSSLVSLDHKEKLYRFRLINDAYSLLSNSSQRQFYDNFKSGWAHGPVKPPVTMSHATYHSDPRYYNAGTWEDFTNLNDEAGTGPMQRISPWTALALVAGLVACMQMASLLTHMQQGLTQRFFTQDETERDLTLAYINYGMDTDKWTRLRRFLWFRTWGLYRNKEDLDREAVLNEKIIEQLKIAGRTDDQDLDNIRKELVRMEDSIIFNFIERSYFMTSPVIYKANDERLPIPNFKGSLLDWTLLHTEMEQSKLRRFESPDQTPFYPENLCAPILPNLSYPRVLAPAGQEVNYNEKIKSIYVEHVVPLISHCDGNSWENLGSTVTADVDALQSLSRRIHFGKFVAEAKFRKNEEKYTQMIRAHDVDGIVASITDSAVEEKILERLKLKAAAYGVDPTDRNGTKKITPEYLVTIYKDYVIPLTKDVEVDYLLRRLE